MQPCLMIDCIKPMLAVQAWVSDSSTRVPKLYSEAGDHLGWHIQCHICLLEA